MKKSEKWRDGKAGAPSVNDLKVVGVDVAVEVPSSQRVEGLAK